MTTAPSPSPSPVALVCEPGFVPGWLDEAGNAQGCVNNGPGDVPSPSPPPSPEPVVAVVSVDAQSHHLAETGVAPLPCGLLAALLVALGATLVHKAFTPRA